MQPNVEPASVMVVEDNDELRDRILVPGLRAEGFSAEGVGSAMALYRALSLRNHDLFVVDVGLPDESGFDVVRHLRQLGGIGIVVLTGRGDPEDRVSGLDHGADAYLIKPVGVNVLAATLRSVQRRLSPNARPNAPSDVMHSLPMAASDWRLDQQGWQLNAPSGERVALSAGERQLLLRLLDAGGEVVEREVILQHLAASDQDEAFDPHRLEMLVHRLRRKVQTAVGEELPLVTVRGVGYLLSF